MFVLDREADLALLADDITADAHRDERRRLAGLLSHGVDTLARVLEHVLRSSAAGDATGEARGFAAWLAEYLERRLTVTAWLLDHWSAAPPLPHEVAIDRAQAAATLARLESVFDRARRDRGLRARLHWDNGRPATRPRVQIRCDRVRKQLVLTVDNAIARRRCRPGPAILGHAGIDEW